MVSHESKSHKDFILRKGEKKSGVSCRDLVRQQI